MNNDVSVALLFKKDSETASIRLPREDGGGGCGRANSLTPQRRMKHDSRPVLQLLSGSPPATVSQSM